MPVKTEEKQVKKLGRPRKETAAPSTAKHSNAKKTTFSLPKETVKIDPFAVLFIKWIGKGDFDIGLNKILSRVITLDPGEIDKLRDG